MKNIVICCDGTGNEFGDANSNVVKLYRILKHDTLQQITYYHPGIGTMGAPGAWSKIAQWWTKRKGEAFGSGILNNLGDAYCYLMNNYEPDDRIYIFGFSRGAYTARALAAMLHMFGLIRKGNEVLVPYVTKIFQHRSDDRFHLARAFKATFCHDCKPHFVGVWDTVSSVGWIYDPLSLPYTAFDPDLPHGRHALSIDERRCFFRQNMWTPKAGDPVDLKQVWFAGVHSDVGGGYTEQESGLSKIALQWMLREAEALGLLVNDDEKRRVLGDTSTEFARPDPLAPMHSSLRGLWWILELWFHKYKDVSKGTVVTKWKIPLGQRRIIPENSAIHQSVVQRMKAMSDYKPSNLPKSYTVVP